MIQRLYPIITKKVVIITFYESISFNLISPSIVELLSFKNRLTTQVLALPFAVVNALCTLYVKGMYPIPIYLLLLAIRFSVYQSCLPQHPFNSIQKYIVILPIIEYIAGFGNIPVSIFSVNRRNARFGASTGLINVQDFFAPII